MNDLHEEKWMYEKFWSLLRDRQLMNVFEAYGPEAFRRSSVLEGFEQFIKAHDFKGSRCVEIGTLKGLTAIVLSRYFSEVISIDICDDPLKWKIAAELDVTNVRFVNVTTNAEKAALINNLDFDGAYVDGDHTNDTESDFALVRKCGQVLFHEHWPAMPPVVDLLNSFDNVAHGGKFAIWRSRHG